MAWLNGRVTTRQGHDIEAADRSVYSAVMRPPHRNRRLGLIALIGSGLVIGIALILSALNENTQFFYNPSDVAMSGFEPKSETFRIGGLVVEGSVLHDGTTTTFDVTDFERPMVQPIRVTHSGQLPNLFREGQGVVVAGQMIGEREFLADEVLAKHDENYQPKIDYQDEIGS